MKPSLQQLYAIESEFEPAFLKSVEAAVSAADNLSNHRAYLEFSDQEKKTPFIELRLTDVKPDPEAAPIVSPDGREDYPRWQATLVVRYCTSRGANSDDQGEVVGWIRGRTMEILGNGGPDFDMPYHFVAQIMPGGTPRAHEPDYGLDVSELQFPIIIEVKPGLF